MNHEVHEAGIEAPGLQSGLAWVEKPNASGALDVNGPEMKQATEAVAAITQEIFGVGFTFTEREDHEIPGDRVIEVHVVDSGEVKAVVSRADKWYQAVSKLPPNVRGFFCLSIE